MFMFSLILYMPKVLVLLIPQCLKCFLSVTLYYKWSELKSNFGVFEVRALLFVAAGDKHRSRVNPILYVIGLLKIILYLSI